VASYLFPPGGQRGKTVPVRVGGLFLYKSCGFELLGPGVEATKQLRSTRTLWFEGPILPLPDSQQAEDYPRDMAGEIKIAADAPLGVGIPGMRLGLQQIGGCLNIESSVSGTIVRASVPAVARPSEEAAEAKSAA